MMRCAIGLAWKDLLVMRKQIAYYLVMMVFYAVLAAVGTFNYGVLGGGVVIFGMLLPMSSFSYDELARWDKYAVSTPAGRQGLVLGKYLFALLVNLASMILVFGISALMIELGYVMAKLTDMAVIVLNCTAVSILLDAVILPILLKYGAEKSRAISMILFLAIFLTTIGAGWLAARYHYVPADWLEQCVTLIVPVCALPGFYLSYRAARRIFARKEL